VLNAMPLEPLRGHRALAGFGAGAPVSATVDGHQLVAEQQACGITCQG
jgi:hypothetical protein